jgi:transposase InsO family protein
VHFNLVASTLNGGAGILQLRCASFTLCVPAPELKGAMFATKLKCTLKEEEVDLSDYEDYHDAYRQIGQFLQDVYMHKRVHSRLGYLTPVEFESQWLLASASAKKVAFT